MNTDHKEKIRELLSHPANEYWNIKREYIRKGTGMNMQFVPEPAPETQTEYRTGCSNIERDPRRGMFLEIPYTLHSDYSNGSTVEESNTRAMWDDFKYLKGMVRIYGGWSTDGLYCHLRSLIASEELTDAIISLYEYPLYNEDDHSMVQIEILESSYEYYDFDFTRELENQSGNEYIADTIDDLESLFYEAEREAEDHSIYPEYQTHDSVALDIEAIARTALQILEERNTAE